MTTLARRGALAGASPRPLAVLWLTLAATCWGIGTALSKQALAEMPPITALAMQLMVSAVFLTLAWRYRRVPHGIAAGTLLGERLAPQQWVGAAIVIGALPYRVPDDPITSRG